MTITKSEITVKFTLEELKGLAKILGGLSRYAMSNGLKLRASEVAAVDPLYTKLTDALEDKED